MTVFPGAAAEDVAQNLSRPLEEEFGTLEGAIRVKSSSQDNLSIVSVEFDYRRDVDLAAVDAQNAIARIRGTLPGRIREPQVLKFSTSDRPIITVGVQSASMTEARQLASDVFAPRFQRIPGVAGVDVFGGAEETVLVEVAPEAARAYAMPIARIVEAISMHSITAPAGSIRTDATHTNFRIEHQATSPEGIANIPVTGPDGVPLRIGDLARVHLGALEPDASFGIDGERAIAMQVFRTEDANTVDVVNEVLGEVERLRQENPNIEFLIGEESASFTEQSISNLLSNVWQALLLASLIIFLFIGRIRSSLVAVVSMPLAYGLTFALMKLAGTEFNMVTLTAVILAVGMVVDASVVVLENITRRTDEGLDAETASVEGTREVQPAVLAGAATTVAVLVPLLFLPGFIGKTFGPLAQTLLFAFLSSVVVALTVVPVLALHAGPSRLDRLAARITRPFDAMMDQVRAFYGMLLRLALSRRWIVVVIALGMFVGGARLMTTRGMEVLPQMDSGSFYVSLQTPPGSSVVATTAVVAAVEQVLADIPQVLKVQSQAGFEQGMKTSSVSGAEGPTQGFITVTLTPRTERKDSIWQIEQRVRQEIQRIPGIKSFAVRELGNTAKSTTSAPIVLRISGSDPLVLDRLADEALAVISGVPNVVEPTRNWEIDQARVRLDVDTLRALELGLTPAKLAPQLVMGSDGVEVSDIRGPLGETTPIHVRYQRSADATAADLLDQPIVVMGERQPITVPMRTVVEAQPDIGQSVVTREAFQSVVEIAAFHDGRPLSFVLEDVESAVGSIDMPRGYQMEVAGEKNDLAEARGGLLGALAIAVIAVYLLLVAQLRSWLHPVTIMLSIPLSLLGVGFSLFLAGKPISMPVMVGLILLVGIVVNNAIILIDFMRQSREEGMSRRQAVLESVEIRFRPIMMTSMSTIVGMIPLAAEWALGAERFSPLAVAVIGGMITATFLTLIIIPVLYDLLDDASTWVTGSLRRVAKVGLVLSIVTIPAISSAQPQLSIDLAEAEKLALETSDELRAEDAQVREAELAERQAFARRLPKFELKTGYSRLSEVEPGALELPVAMPDQPPQSVVFGEAITDVFQLRVTATQPIFSGFGLSAAHRVSRISGDIAEAERRQAHQDLLLQTRETYLSALAARELVAVAEGSVQMLTALQQRIESLAEAGRASKAEVAQLEARIASAVSARDQARGQLELRLLRLKYLLGVDPKTTLTLTETLAVESVAQAAAALPATERSELQIARYRAALLQARIGVASRDLWPRFALQAGYTLATPHERYFPPRNELNDSWDLSLVMTWTIWDFGITWNERARAKARTESARHRLAHLEKMTAFAHAQVRQEISNAERELRSAAVRRDAARTSFELTELRFEAGRATATDVIAAELEVTRAEADIVQAIVSRQVALARQERLGAQQEVR